MKKLLVTGLALGIGMATAAYAGIDGSGHDFGTTPGGAFSTADNEICIACHTPHNAYGPGPGFTNNLVPLWNHQTTVATFQVYTSPTGTLNATVGQPAGVSLACLSCHDGTIGVFAYYEPSTGNISDPTVLPATSTALLGTDLSNDHPVSFTYNTALATADGELYDPSTAIGVAPGTIDNTMLFNGNMECGSCHDVHNTRTPAGVGYLLLKDNTDSALCLTCHNK